MAKRESSLEERERQDTAKADAIKERQIRLGHVPAPEKKKTPAKKSAKKNDE